MAGQQGWTIDLIVVQTGTVKSPFGSHWEIRKGVTRSVVHNAGETLTPKPGTEVRNKTFDALAWMRTRREKIDEEDQGLWWEEKHIKTRQCEAGAGAIHVGDSTLRESPLRILPAGATFSARTRGESLGSFYPFSILPSFHPAFRTRHSEF